jgi:KEOPS complex subunit Cgi121
VDLFLQHIGSLARKHSVVIQVFYADMIFGVDHIVSAVNHAVRAFKQRTNVTNSLEMEILLYASGERQIKQAIPKMGVKEGEGNIALLLFHEGKNIEHKVVDSLLEEIIDSMSLARDDRVLEADENMLEKFGIMDVERGTVAKNKYRDLVLERVAMVDVIK